VVPVQPSVPVRQPGRIILRRGRSWQKSKEWWDERLFIRAKARELQVLTVSYLSPLGLRKDN
jgi:hypothetical protein